MSGAFYLKAARGGALAWIVGGPLLAYVALERENYGLIAICLLGIGVGVWIVRETRP